MTMTEEFTPRWASPPGDTIKRALVDLDITVDALAEHLRVDSNQAAGLLDGSTHVSIAVARGLSEVFGGTATFWMTRETHYRESLEWVEADKWVSLLSRHDLAEVGWVEPVDGWRNWVSECMSFFDVRSPAELNEHLSKFEHARFRARPQSAAQRATIAAWLNKVQTDAKALSCESWNASAFRRMLPKLAELSKVPDPTVFIPALQKLCATVGVIVVVVRPPSGCPVSGVSLTLPSGARVIGLSARYLADDHVWFTFFHEAGHVLLHDPAMVFVDDIEAAHATQDDGPEAEADRFASDCLLPAELRRDLVGRLSPRQVHGLAHRAGVSPGVVVGQLQHVGLLAFGSPLNRLKHRYSWKGATLSRGSA